MGVSTPVRLIVAEEQRTLAQALTWRLDAEADLTVVATVCSFDGAKLALPGGSVDLLLLGTGDDGTVGGTPCPVVLDELAQRHPELRVVVMSSCSDAAMVAQAVHSGVAGWVPKEAGVGLLLDTLRG